MCIPTISITIHKLIRLSPTNDIIPITSAYKQPNALFNSDT